MLASHTKHLNNWDFVVERDCDNNKGKEKQLNNCHIHIEIWHNEIMNRAFLQ